MHFYGTSGRKISLKTLKISKTDAGGFGERFTLSGSKHSGRLSELMTRANVSIFERTEESGTAPPAAFRDAAGHLRVVYKEISVRFKKSVSSATRKKMLGSRGFKVRYRNSFHSDQCVVYHPNAKYVGVDLVDVANDWMEAGDVLFAAPNFVSEYHRSIVPANHREQWHLRNQALFSGQLAGEDVDIRRAWRATRGRPGIVVAVLDDGVDIDHPNLKPRILRNPDPNNPGDGFGRDFFLASTHPDHFNPRPKIFQSPFDRLAGNDIHGTPCAGVVASSGKVANVRGAAPRCRILPVKIFHADALASDARVADAIRYASRFADILSCSWSAGSHPDIELAIEDAGLERGGRGAAVFCAAGNGFASSVSFPARHPDAIAIGASTDRARIANYSNVGPQISVVAPSSGGVRGIYNTDVSVPNRGFNLGTAAAGGVDGLHTNDFGGTSSATPLAAGVAALMLSANSGLTRSEIKAILEQTADKIGPANSYGPNGHSNVFGFGRVNAGAAVRSALAARAADRASSASKKKATKAKKAKK